MSGRLPEHAVRRAVNLQSWVDLTFLHWRVPAEALRGRLPRGLELEETDGSAWLGVVPFRMADVRTPGTPPPPGWSSFPECNVRTYVRGPGGRTGVWFLRLVAANRPFVGAMRMVGLPYVHAPSTARRDDDARYAYRFPALGSQPSSPPLVCRTTVGAELDDAERTPLVDSLTGRWGTWARLGGRLAHVPIHHAPWPLRHAEVEIRSLPDEVAGVPLPDEEPLVHFSPGVATRIGFPGAA